MQIFRKFFKKIFMSNSKGGGRLKICTRSDSYIYIKKYFSAVAIKFCKRKISIFFAMFFIVFLL